MRFFEVNVLAGVRLARRYLAEAVAGTGITVNSILHDVSLRGGRSGRMRSYLLTS